MVLPEDAGDEPPSRAQCQCCREWDEARAAPGKNGTGEPQEQQRQEGEEEEVQEEEAEGEEEEGAQVSLEGMG